jgi:2-polyprenyl-6-hydroxyphenyl methylase / 3-demethylubiquinone-9 3-methyltransferase
MAVDNELYNRMAKGWWDENNFLYMLKTSLNPVRFGYFRGILIDTLQVDPKGKRVLDIGCGGGLLAEEFARLGSHVTGLDPSTASLETARAHAGQEGLDIEYRVGYGEQIPFHDATFDIAYCCDVLEHVSNLEQVIAETARVLKPGGIYLYDTINRTLPSNLIMIKIMQDWSHVMPANLHSWDAFIKPKELFSLFAKHGLENGQFVGMAPGGNPVQLIQGIRQLKRGAVTYGEFGRRQGFKQVKDTSVSYMGYAIKH